MRCGLLGQKLGHSYSPQIHRSLGDYSYDLFEIQPNNLESFLKNEDFHGINVTIPYKKAVIPYCSELSPIAAKLGAVNTVLRRADGTLIGHNTDYFGFASMLSKSGLSVSGKKALVLGSGGASTTACAVLKEYGAHVVVISRTGKDNYDNLSNHKNAAIIVNTTPVGMYPNNGESAVDISIFPALEGVLDLIYNPARTKLILDAENRGIVAEDGLWMLVAQAKESAEWFLNKTISNDFIQRIHAKIRGEMQNIVLIGMPGSGKSTIGALLAKAIHKTFVDADAEIENTAKMAIPDIFAKYGEAGFRQIETRVLTDLGKRSNIVLSTGGGCVTKKENYPLLHQNGMLIWLQRDISQLPTDGRPLSQLTDLQAMYRQREPLYANFADAIVENNDAPEQTLHKLLSLEGIL